MKKYILLPTLIGMLLISSFMFAQNTEKISPSLQKGIIEELSRQIKKEYILEDIGFKMSSRLDSLSKIGSRTEMDSEAFIKMLNQELRSVYADKHLGVVNPKRFKEFQKMLGLDQNQKKDHHSKLKQKSNHNMHDYKNGQGSHAEDADKVIGNELAGSRVINRDGRTNIGLINLSRFDGTEKGLMNMKELLSSFVGVDAVIIDLRNCKGGDAEMVKALSGYFFDTSTYLVSTIGRKGENGKRETIERWAIANELSSKFVNTPLYIMTSALSFSAAESFSFGLQLNKRAILVGETTGGGGHMNAFFALPGGYGVSISVGRTFDGKTGKGFQGTGVQADILIEADHAFAKTLELIKHKRTAELGYDDSKEKVHQTLQQLSEAWYTGDFKSAKSLIYSKYKAYLSIDNESIVNEVNLLKLIENGTGAKTPREVRNREISIYEVRNDETATARLMFRDQIHYLHLINDNGTWKIISDLITLKQMHG
ncbi:S41 family peptidase [Ekhidna sp.]|uniref:S41 family peptidase n=1 Tax=Ekhidna sp. TaxID=2608089 RepID=UPI003298FE94